MKCVHVFLYIAFLSSGKSSGGVPDESDCPVVTLAKVWEFAGNVSRERKRRLPGIHAEDRWKNWIKNQKNRNKRSGNEQTI